MDLFDSIPFPFQIFPPRWVKSAPAKCLRILFVISLWIYLLNELAGVISMMSGLIRSIFNLLVFYTVFFALPPLVVVVILVESIIKRDALKKFESDIKFIDTIIEHNLHINVDDKSLIRRRMFRWSLFSSFVLIMYFNYWWYVRDDRQLTLWATFCMMFKTFTPCWFIIQIHFFRVAMFIERIRYRYRLINKYIKHFHGYTNLDFLHKSWSIGIFLNSNESFGRLKNLRRVYRLLYLASHSINDLFGLSLFVCVFQCFVALTLSTYTAILTTFTKFGNCIDCLCMIIGFVANIISLVSACELTGQEV